MDPSLMQIALPIPLDPPVTSAHFITDHFSGASPLPFPVHSCLGLSSTNFGNIFLIEEYTLWVAGDSFSWHFRKSIAWRMVIA